MVTNSFILYICRVEIEQRHLKTFLPKGTFEIPKCTKVLIVIKAKMFIHWGSSNCHTFSTVSCNLLISQFKCLSDLCFSHVIKIRYC